MNKEELLQKIKDDVAKLNGHHKMEDCTYIPHLMALMEAVAKRYAIAMCEEQKKACAEGSKIVLSDYGKKSDGSYGWNTRSVDYFAMDDGNNIKIDKQSILETKNVAE